MTEAEKLKLVHTLTEDETVSDDLLSAFLADAEEIILMRRYPYSYEEIAELPSIYHRKQCKLAAFMYNKRGAEGETIHDENGIRREWDSQDIPEEFLRGIMPLAAGLGGTSDETDDS